MNTNLKGKKGFMTLDLDMSKAYDRVEWSFLVGVMSRLGFESRWINLILKFISSVSYSVLINGEITFCDLESFNKSIVGESFRTLSLSL